MIPVEFLWLTLIGVFCVIGMVRGLLKELGVTTILLLSLFVLKFGWEKLVKNNIAALPGNLDVGTIRALYYIIPLVFVAYIAYEGVTLQFPIKALKGLGKAFFGLFGGLLNGYLLVGSIWDVVNQANYFGSFGWSGNTIEIAKNLTTLHNSITQFLPIIFVNEYVMLILGMILLLAIILK